MKRALITAFLVSGLLTASTFSWAQFDMRNSANPYRGMGRTGFALEDNARKVQEEKAARKAQQQPAQQKGQSKSTQQQKQKPKQTSR